MAMALSLKEMSARYAKLYGGPIYDVLEPMGLPNQVLSHEIRPLLPTMRIAGPAFTVHNTSRPRREDDPDTDLMSQLTDPCVVVVQVGRDLQSGNWGELMSNAAQARGARGVVIDGGTRDSREMMEIPGWGCWCRYACPIESGSRNISLDMQVPIFMSGSLTSVVRVEPGDMIFADSDGAIVVPKDIAEEVLIKAEDKVERENLARVDLRKGMTMQEALENYGVG